MRFVLSLIGILLCIFTSGQEEVSVQRFTSIPDNSSINDILVLDSLIYVASNTGLIEINSNTLEAEVLRTQSCDAIALGVKNTIWASFERRYLENINTKVKTNYDIKEITVRDIIHYKGQIWVATDKGILTVNTRTNALNNSMSERNSDLPNDKINFLYVDDQDQMWIGTENGIVLINKKKKWKVYEKKLDMEAMHYNHEGLWLVSNKEMWVVDPFNRWYPTAIDRGLREGKIRDITADASGKLYLASEILVKYDPYEEKIESFAETPGLISKLCSTVESDKNNRIWVGTENSGLYVIGFLDQAVETKLSAVCIVEKNIQCVGEMAKVNLRIIGGTAPYSINWSDNVTNQKQRELSAGQYSVKITDAVQNSTSASITIEDKRQMRMIVLETSQESKVDAGDAKATISISGGTSPYKVKWDNGETGLKAFQLKNGIHGINITDKNNCHLLSSLEIKADRILPDLQIAKIKVGQTLQINNLFFQADSTDIIEESYPVLDEIYDFLSSNNSVVIEIGGHTNNIPSHEYCDRLSTDRAKSVAYYLFNKGIHQDRISYKGYGKRNPIASNRSLAGRKKNQRVEIKIVNIAG